MSLIKELLTYLVTFFSVGFFGKKIKKEVESAGVDGVRDATCVEQPLLEINKDSGLFRIDSLIASINAELVFLLNKFTPLDSKIEANRKILEALRKISGVAEDKILGKFIFDEISVGINNTLIVFAIFISPDGFVYFIKMVTNDEKAKISAWNYEIKEVLYLGKSRIYNTNNIEDTYTRNMVRIVKEEDIASENFQIVVNLQENSFVLSVSNIKQFAKYRQKNTDHFTIGFGSGDLVFLDKKSNTKKLK